MTPDEVERLAREAGLVRYSGNWCSKHHEGINAADLARFSALVQANALSEAHAAIDASEAKIIRNASQGYPEGRAPRELTLVERIKALDTYAADWRRWCIEAEHGRSTAPDRR